MISATGGDVSDCKIEERYKPSNDTCFSAVLVPFRFAGLEVHIETPGVAACYSYEYCLSVQGERLCRNQVQIARTLALKL
jgi:hypothetical protein